MQNTDLDNTDLDGAVAGARGAYVVRNPESQARFEAATASMPGGNTRSVLHYDPFPLGIARGEGCRLWDMDGAEYVDFLGEYTAGLYGHSNPVIRAAIDRALDQGISFGASNPAEPEFARALCERFPSIERLRFTNSGTEANLMALATACAVTGRRKVLVFHGGYHGGVLSFAGGGSPINAPYDFVLGRYNDSAGTAALIDTHGVDLAAILLEPMLGSGGCIPAEPDFLQMLRQRSREVGALLVLDEVMTSRLAPGGLQARHGITPDLTTLGKYLGGGMSFGAFGGRADIIDRFDPRRPDAFAHAGTFNNNVLTMAAGLAGLTQVFTPEAQTALNGRGEALRERLNAICRAYSVKMQFTGIGSMLSVHMRQGPIRRPEDVAGTDPRLKELFFFDMLASGIWLARRGMMALSLPIADAECDRLADAVEEFCQSRRSLLANEDTDR